MIYLAKTSDTVISNNELKELLSKALAELGHKKKVLAVPPDITRIHSRAGMLTSYAYAYYQDAMTDILPAIGTHRPMTSEEIKEMYGDIPAGLFREHDWREGIVTLGEVPGDYVNEVSEGKVDYAWPAQAAKLLVTGGHDLILSIGQVVPHEVIGMANYNKNIFVGTGGVEGINKSHYLGAVYGMERIMGRADTPVRRVLNYASDNFTRDLPIVYVLTVVGNDADGNNGVRGLFIGDDYDCFVQASELALECNFTLLDKPLKKVLVSLEPGEYKSTWLGNKSIYRTRMAIEDGGELIVLGPAVREFGEDSQIDKLIRKYGYMGTDKVLAAVKDDPELAANLSAAAHLVHGSTDGRFSVTYCAGQLSSTEIETAGFKYAEHDTMYNKYMKNGSLKEGHNVLPDGEEIYYISNPGLGLWACRDRF